MVKTGNKRWNFRLGGPTDNDAENEMLASMGTGGGASTAMMASLMEMEEKEEKLLKNLGKAVLGLQKDQTAMLGMLKSIKEDIKAK